MGRQRVKFEARSVPVRTILCNVHASTLAHWRARSPGGIHGNGLFFRDANGGGFCRLSGREDGTMPPSSSGRRLAPLLILFLCESLMARGAERRRGNVSLCLKCGDGGGGGEGAE